MPERAGAPARTLQRFMGPLKRSEFMIFFTRAGIRLARKGLQARGIHRAPRRGRAGLARPRWRAADHAAVEPEPGAASTFSGRREHLPIRNPGHLRRLVGPAGPLRISNFNGLMECETGGKPNVFRTGATTPVPLPNSESTAPNLADEARAIASAVRWIGSGRDSSPEVILIEKSEAAERLFALAARMDVAT